MMTVSLWILILLVILDPGDVGYTAAKIKHGYDLKLKKLREQERKDAPPPPKDWGE